MPITKKQYPNLTITKIKEINKILRFNPHLESDKNMMKQITTGVFSEWQQQYSDNKKVEIMDIMLGLKNKYVLL